MLEAGLEAGLYATKTELENLKKDCIKLSHSNGKIMKTDEISDGEYSVLFSYMKRLNYLQPVFIIFITHSGENSSRSKKTILTWQS